jgi:hypothetical protein
MDTIQLLEKRYRQNRVVLEMAIRKMENFNSKVRAINSD